MTWTTPDHLAYDPARHDALAGDPYSADWPETPIRNLLRPCTTAPDQRPQVAANSSAATQDHDPGRSLRARGVAPS